MYLCFMYYYKVLLVDLFYIFNYLSFVCDDVGINVYGKNLFVFYRVGIEFWFNLILRKYF